MLIKTTGIVLQQHKYSESSLILDVFTPDYGRISFIIGGVRKAGSKTSTSALRPAMMVDLVAYFKDPQKLQRIKEVSSHVIYQRIPFDIIRGNSALFLVEVIQQMLQRHGSDEALFQLAYEKLIDLDTHEKLPSTFLHEFLIQMAAISGFNIEPPSAAAEQYFDIKSSRFTEQMDAIHGIGKDESRLLMLLIEKNAMHKRENQLSSTTEAHITRSTRRSLMDALIRYTQWHQPGFKSLKTVQVLRDLVD
jgi:DNA repair protein RecO (recombination protein O)